MRGRVVNVIYAVNSSEAHLAAARVSYQSAIRHGLATTVTVHVFGPPPARGWRASLGSDVGLVSHPGAVRDVYLMKWEAIAGTPNDEFLFLDADTVVFGPLGTLRRLGHSEGVLAREELNCDRRPRSQVDHESLTRLAAGADVWVPNTGMMLFRGGVHRDLTRDLEPWFVWAQRFRSYPSEYPCSNPHIVEEVVACLMMAHAGVPQLRATARECLFYEERRRPISELVHQTTVLHTWGRYMRWLQPGLERWLKRS